MQQKRDEKKFWLILGNIMKKIENGKGSKITKDVI